MIEIKLPPVTPATLALFAGGSHDHNPIHLDSTIARSAGYDDVFAQGMLTMAYLARLLTNHVAPTDIVEFGVRFVDIVRLGDELTLFGQPLSEARTDSLSAVDLRVAAGSRTVLTGRALLRTSLLPSDKQ